MMPVENDIDLDDDEFISDPQDEPEVAYEADDE